MAGKIDKLVRSFLQDTSNPSSDFDAFKDLQDPTFMSFKLDFFPDNGNSMTEDAYSAGGLLRQRSDPGSNTPGNYELNDSAEEYLSNIGAPAHEAYLHAFKKLLLDIQEKAPWYFQSITGLGELYKIDKTNNFRAAEKELTIECLESIDLRMTLLADLYRNSAFDLKYFREILPVNLRTFNMRVHVLEMRTFNTTFGKIADSYAKNRRPVSGQENQMNTLNNTSALQRNNNVYKSSITSLASPLFSNASSTYADINSKLGGVFSNLGQQSGANFGQGDVSSAFEAISVITFDLKNCEFDFFSEAPAYLDSVSVKESSESTYKFKIKVGKITKTTRYPFWNYVISEQEKYSRISSPKPVSAHYYEGQNPTGNASIEDLRDYKQAIYPTTSESQAASEIQRDSNALKKTALDRVLGGLIKSGTDQATNIVTSKAGNATGGLLGNSKLGNVYGENSLQDAATSALNSFLTPANKISTTPDNSYSPPAVTLKKIAFDTINLASDIDKNILDPAPKPKPFRPHNVYKTGEVATPPNDDTKIH